MQIVILDPTGRASKVVCLVEWDIIIGIYNRFGSYGHYMNTNCKNLELATGYDITDASFTTDMNSL